MKKNNVIKNEASTSNLPVAAVYARYSTNNQDPTSIDDQVKCCLEYARRNNYHVPEELIFRDDAVSGTERNRVGLGALLNSAELKQCSAVIFFDPTRLTRTMRDAMEIKELMEFYDIKLIFAADGLTSDSPGFKIQLQAVMLAAELYIDMAKQHTGKAHKRLLEGGFLAGSVPYGFTTVEVQGGKKPKIIEEEAEILRRIFQEFIEGASLAGITLGLNNAKVASRSGGGWNISEVSRILKNETYRGIYIRNRTTTKKDPKTRKKITVKLPPQEWLRVEMPEFRVIPDEVWLKAKEKFETLNSVFPTGGRGSGFVKQKFGRNKSYPESLLSGCLKCAKCGGAFVQVSGKNGGYFGCRNARDGRCDVRKLIRRDLLEKIFLEKLSSIFDNCDAIEKMIRAADEKIKEKYQHLPGQIKSAQKKVTDCRKGIANLKDAIKQTGYRKDLMDDIDSDSMKLQKLEEELHRLLEAQQFVPQCPPQSWIKEQLQRLRELLNRKLGLSALAIQKFLGDVILKVQTNEKGEKGWLITSSLGAMPLLLSFFSTSSSRSLQMWRWRELNPRPRNLSTSFLHV